MQKGYIGSTPAPKPAVDGVKYAANSMHLVSPTPKVPSLIAELSGA